MIVCVGPTPSQLRAWARWLSLQTSSYLLRGAKVEHVARLVDEVAFLTVTASGAQPAPLN